MEMDALRDLKKASPFRTFVVRLKDGRTYRVDHPEKILAPPGGETVVLWDPGHHLHFAELTDIADAMPEDDTVDGNHAPAPAG